MIAELTSPELQLQQLQTLLEDGLDVKYQDSIGFTHLHWVSYSNNVTVVKFLLDHGAAPNSEAGYKKETPLDCAVCSREEATADIIRTLVKYGADIKREKNEKSFIDEATDITYGCSKVARTRCHEITKALIECGVKPNKASDVFFQETRIKIVPK